MRKKNNIKKPFNTWNVITSTLAGGLIGTFAAAATNNLFGAVPDIKEFYTAFLTINPLQGIAGLKNVFQHATENGLDRYMLFAGTGAVLKGGLNYATQVNKTVGKLLTRGITLPIKGVELAVIRPFLTGPVGAFAAVMLANYGTGSDLASFLFNTFTNPTTYAAAGAGYLLGYVMPNTVYRAAMLPINVFWKPAKHALPIILNKKHNIPAVKRNFKKAAIRNTKRLAGDIVMLGAVLASVSFGMSQAYNLVDPKNVPDLVATTALFGDGTALNWVANQVLTGVNHIAELIRFSAVDPLLGKIGNLQFRDIADFTLQDRLLVGGTAAAASAVSAYSVNYFNKKVFGITDEEKTIEHIRLWGPPKLGKC